MTRRYKGLRPGTTVRLAFAGTRTDTLRVLLTAFSAALAALAALSALTVLTIPARGPTFRGVPWEEHYSNPLLREGGLRPGVAFALLLLCIPVLALAGQCARIGAPARDRRLAAIRMAGATPRQTATVAAAETGAASLLGTVVGLAVHLALRELLHRPNAEGRLPLPTDVMPPPGAMVAVVLGLPLLATLAAALMLRRVTLSPFGLTRGSRRGTPHAWPGVLILVGLAAATFVQPVLEWYMRQGRAVPEPLLPLLFFGGCLCAVLGVVLGTGWISYTAGRILHRYARRPSTLLAARRLQDDPWNGSRTFAALLTCAVFGAGSAAVRAWFVAQIEAEAVRQRLSDKAAHIAPLRPGGPEDGFYLGTMDLIDIAVGVALVITVIGLLVAIAESVVSRRRTHAALVATGVPRSVLGRAQVWQTLTPVLPASLLALTVGTLLGRSFGSEGSAPGGPVCPADAPECGAADGAVVPDVVRQARVPLEELSLYGLGTLALVLAAVGVGLLFLRTSTDLDELRST
ncbi:MAG TPA: FtsX-like permease family protein [Streptomyces sp.]|jgi:hypothetical protein|nr:FtsX-like permease family protein [Streptomyces sp.]